MKKIALVSMVVLVMTVLWACNSDGQLTKDPESGLRNIKNKQTINLYFTGLENSTILLETREVTVENKEDLPETAIQELLKGPTGAEMKRAIPKETELIDINQDGSDVMVNFSKGYYLTGDVGEIVSRFSVVNTLCDLPNVRRVKILVEGEEYIGPNGEPFGFLDKDDVLITDNVKEENNKLINLYFSDADASQLVRENRWISVKGNGNLERYIIQALIEGPQDKELSKTVPPETKIISVETKEDTCFVNLSEEFQLKHWGGSSGEIMTIYSIVNSLTELSNIKNVQFLIEGKKVDIFKHMVFNEPFQRDESLIKK